MVVISGVIVCLRGIIPNIWWSWCHAMDLRRVEALKSSLRTLGTYMRVWGFELAVRALR